MEEMIESTLLHLAIEYEDLNKEKKIKFLEWIFKRDKFLYEYAMMDTATRRFYEPGPRTND